MRRKTGTVSGETNNMVLSKQHGIAGRLKSKVSENS